MLKADSEKSLSQFFALNNPQCILLKNYGKRIMKRMTLCLAFIILCLLVIPAQAENKNMEVFSYNDYIIGPGDVLDISVWKNEDLTKAVIVLPDGKISLPLIGNVLAANKTVAQLTSELKEKLIRYMPDPVLSVIVAQVNSMLIYVIGKVHRPGRFDLNTNINVLQALSIAGGLNPFAKKDEIRILRKEKGITRTFSFHYDDVVNKNRLDQNIMLHRGDVVVVP